METNLQEQNYDRRPIGISGLGGWLVLIQIGLYFSILLLSIQLFKYSLPIFGTDTWDTLTSTQSEAYHPMWGPLIIFETVYNIVFLLFSVFILVIFYGKKRIFPRLMIIFYSVSLAIGIIDLVLSYQIPIMRELADGSSIREILKSVIACIIWIPYLMKSERVQNTFIR